MRNYQLFMSWLRGFQWKARNVDGNGPDERSAFDPHAYEKSPAFLRTKHINDDAHKSLEVSINRMRLPAALLRLIINGRWRVPDDSRELNQLLGNEVNFYSLNHLPFENSHWIQEAGPRWLGTPCGHTPPGDFDPAKSVLIADLGPGMNQPIALDYRRDEASPNVLVLQHQPTDHWVQIASS